MLALAALAALGCTLDRGFEQRRLADAAAATQGTYATITRGDKAAAAPVKSPSARARITRSRSGAARPRQRRTQLSSSSSQARCGGATAAATAMSLKAQKPSPRSAKAWCVPPAMWPEKRAVAPGARPCWLASQYLAAVARPAAAACGPGRAQNVDYS
mgnify:CR=1 FL=1